jgi:hypothetical protein
MNDEPQLEIQITPVPAGAQTPLTKDEFASTHGSRQPTVTAKIRTRFRTAVARTLYPLLPVWYLLPLVVAPVMLARCQESPWIRPCP